MASKLDTLTEIEGFSDPMEMVEETFNDGAVPGICTNEDCDYTTYVEPDSRTGYCEECESQTVASAQVLAGVI